MENHLFIHPIVDFFMRNNLGGDVQYLNNIIV